MEIQTIEQNIIVAAFQKNGGTQDLVNRIADEVRKHVPDVSTKKGRDEIGSIAMKVSKSKTLISKLGKELVADEKARIKLVDSDRIQAEKELDALRDEILAPRSAWEQAEKDRVAKCHEFINEITEVTKPEFINNSAWQLKSYIETLEGLKIDSRFMEFADQAKIAKFETLETLRTALANREKYEAEQAELERLRQAEQARLQREHEERIACEAAEKATREAEEKARFESERVQREKAESEQREARLVAEKEAAMLREQQAKEFAENQARQAEIDKAIANERAVQALKQAEHNKNLAIQAEREKIERQAIEQAEMKKKEQEAREANKAHKKQVCDSILSELDKIGISEQLGQALIKAIYANKIPSISIEF